MNTIWKFPLVDTDNIIEAHIVEFLCVQMQNDIPCAWAIVNPDRPAQTYRIYEIGTGWELPKINASHYIDTVQDNEHVWHYFWELIPGIKSADKIPLMMFSSR